MIEIVTKKSTFNGLKLKFAFIIGMSVNKTRPTKYF